LEGVSSRHLHRAIIGHESEKEIYMITSTHAVVLRRRIRTLACSPVLVILFLCLAAAAPLHLHAQTSKGILAGVIRDSSGALLPNATILITNEDTHETRTVTSSSTGAYRIEAINPGNYHIHVTSSGFSPFDVQHVSVLPSVVTTYDATLAIGESTSSVTVEAETNAINSENSPATSANRSCSRFPTSH
jgi:hypothetical protein